MKDGRSQYEIVTFETPHIYGYIYVDKVQLMKGGGSPCENNMASSGSISGDIASTTVFSLQGCDVNNHVFCVEFINTVDWCL